jgi:hypothetical protein
MTRRVWLQLLSTALFFGVLGGGAFLLFKTQTAGGGKEIEKADSRDDDNDILGNARRIMDKYNK